ncbi:MAG: hypothetical protein QXT26_06020 [Thermoproteota archaeon]
MLKVENKGKKEEFSCWIKAGELCGPWCLAYNLEMHGSIYQCHILDIFESIYEVEVENKELLEKILLKLK